MRYLVLVLCLCLTAACAVSAPPGRPTGPPSDGPRDSAGPPTFGIFTGTVSEPAMDRYARSGATEIPIFYHYDLDWGPDGEADGYIEEDRLRLAIRDKLPEADTDQWVCLDLEHIYTTVLRAGPRDPRWERIQREMCKAADILKAMRPNVRVAFWGFPMINGMWKDQKGRSQPWHSAPAEIVEREAATWTAPTELLKRIDWFAPSVYDIYPDAVYEEWYGKMQESRFKLRLAMCRRIKPGIPVLPSVTPRVATKDEAKSGRVVLSRDEIWSDQIEVMLTARCEGFIWWGADAFYYRAGKLPREEIEPGLERGIAERQHFARLHNDQFTMFHELSVRYQEALKKLPAEVGSERE